MSEFRFSALSNIATANTQAKSKTTDYANGSMRISEIFAQNVFNLMTMKEYLSEGTFYKMVEVIKHNSRIDFQTAENVAKGMKKWATDHGVTHYTHWFQPLTGTTAEKHDAFYKPSLDITVQGMESLSAAELIQREPDASSFPSGGLRNTALARGYTIWDPSSPAFILESENGKTLYIPSVFISYTGESLDNKTPLLKSNELLNVAATAVCHYFDSTVHNVITTLGWEQEYFLIDEHFYNARPDLVMTGRTLFGGKPARGQQLEDHYFASIPERVQAYMIDFEKECLKLGIPVLTRHNEVAPGQYECAPMFEELNVAVDHNLLLMNVMEKVAKKHGLKVLFHEKPFAGVNGSGKHNNWSMATDKGKNLLSPGSNPSLNLYFLTFFINVVKAIDTHADLLRASIASAGNEYRLGANEAPPAIISVFTGTFIEAILKDFKVHGLSDTGVSKHVLDLNIPKIPEIVLDNTDRNRTSPFPFTGNKFEFRAVGSSANCSQAMTVLNTIVANQLVEFKRDVDTLIEGGSEQEAAIVSVLRKYLTESDRIIFNGDGYGKEWEKESARRGLGNLKTTPEALKAYVSEKSERLFEQHHIFTKHELEARYEVELENYIKKVDIECLIMEEMLRTHILPATNKHLSMLLSNYRGLSELHLQKAADKEKAEIEQMYNIVDEIKENCAQMMELREKAHAKKEIEARAQLFSQKIRPYFEVIRGFVDSLEKMVDDDFWKLPKYREMLFLK
jgi:glutamine synthetase